MVRKLAGPVLGLVAVPALVLTGCGSGGETAGTPSGPEAVQEETTSGPADAANTLSCAPGSGRMFADEDPMNSTDLSGAALDCAVFDDQTMNTVLLTEAQLSGAEFRESTLNRVDFTRATLVGAVFEESTLNSVDFSEADLSGADLREAQLNAVNFAGATCPDGAAADGDSCAAHLTPLPIEPGAGPGTDAEPPGETPDAPAPTATTNAPQAPDGPVAPPAFNDTVQGTYRCEGGDVLVNGADSDLHLTGTCGTVIVNGADSEVEVDAAPRILVNGARASVTYHGESQVVVNGAGATAHQG
ncbi:pentapeptide repeat-containing protein [Actinophytocola sp.]|uniref:pentapeptide repeat-containing protein n=1 Tax=Actinophytocola sp. TaxID=1872138 RepID=UPI003D6B56A7